MKFSELFYKFIGRWFSGVSREAWGPVLPDSPPAEAS